MRLPVADQSRVVLIGTTTYSGHLAEAPLKSVRSNVLDLVEVFSHPDYGGFLREHCTAVIDENDPDVVLGVLEDNAKVATDVFLVYLAAHALKRGPAGNELHLCLPGTDPDQNRWWRQALPFGEVRDIVRQSPAANRIVVVDACFAGLILPDAMGPSGLFDVAGAYTLAAVGPNMQAVAPVGARRTAFTNALVDVLTDGIDGHDDLLSLPRVFPYLRNVLVSEGYPEPRQHLTQTIEHLAVVRNRANYPDGTLPSHVVDMLTNPVNTVRVKGLTELGNIYFSGASPSARSRARAEVVNLIGDDSHLVSDEANRVLAMIDGAPSRGSQANTLGSVERVVDRRRALDSWWLTAGVLCGLLSAVVLLLLGNSWYHTVFIAVPVAVVAYLAALGTDAAFNRGRAS
jgi:hypothetical protein